MVKRKTRKNNKHRGGAGAPPAEAIAEMPQICVGTAQYNKHNPCTIGPIVSVALAFGYRHIDGAESYGPAAYRKALGAALRASCVPRNQIWLTWKSDNITAASIARQIADLNCAYIDLFLIHHSCGTPAQFAVLEAAQAAGQIRHFGVSNCDDIDDLRAVLEAAQAAGQIRHFGVSNCDDIDDLRAVKAAHNIFANQIQAGPPAAKVDGKEDRSPTFIRDCNDAGVAVMLYAPISGATMSETLYEGGNEHLAVFSHENAKNLNRYYTQKYVVGKPNVLMVGSTTGRSLPKNMDEFTDTLRGTNLLKAPEMAEMETFLDQIVLANMG
jgi:diketogulonate reductase-like aldo/keto reductase